MEHVIANKQHTLGVSQEALLLCLSHSLHIASFAALIDDKDVAPHDSLLRLVLDNVDSIDTSPGTKFIIFLSKKKLIVPSFL